MDEILPVEMSSLASGYIESAQAQLSISMPALDSCIVPGAPQYALATKFLNLLVRGDRHLASQLIQDTVSQGVGIKDIYLQVFQPCQQELGRLWQMNRISVAQEHFGTIATQMVMAQLYPTIFSAEKKVGHRLLAASVGGELHEIGMRMVADFLEMDGWTTYYLGSNTPAESILRTLEDQKIDVLAISATMTLHVSKVTSLINQIRSSPGLSAVKILVGGYPFNIAADLWRQVGADGYAPNAQAAVSAANQLVGDIL